LFAVACGSAHAAAGDTLAQVKTRGTLRCGVSEGIAGFSIKDAAGRWTGLDADFCRAVAAAALGDANKVTFIPLRASERFPALQARTIDLLARNTTWTMVREAAIKVQFAGILFYDGQGFMVPSKSGVKSAAGLKNATVCVQKNTTSARHLAHYSGERGLGMKLLVIDSAVEVADAFFAGRCGAFTSDASQLAAARSRVPGGAQAYLILPERISKEPLGPAVRGGDDDWLTLVRWTLFALVAAEEAGVTRENIRERLRDPAVQRALGAGEEFGKMLGTDRDWAVRVVESAGNYGEMFERNVGSASPLKLQRGLNRLWTKGGLMYAPPTR
jgi:general L-amino acid transport system substrate-binding protein